MKEETRDLSIGQALDLGYEMAMAGNHDSAMGLFRGVLMHEPENLEAVERLGASLFELRRFHEALYWFWRGRKIGRRSAMALTNYGLTVAQLGHWDEALPDLERAVSFAERDNASPQVKALVYNNLGNTLEKLRRYEDALIALDRGIACNPDDSFPHYNRGIVLLRLNRQREAITALDRAIAINPDDADAHYNRGMGRLLLGDLKGGFEDYEYRLLTTENKVPNLGLPAEKKWDGRTPIFGKTILVHCEQGLGDDIQMFRFLPHLTMGGVTKVLVMSHSATAPLLAGMPPEIEVLTPGTALPPYDQWVALMSLPLMLDVRSEAAIPPPWSPVGFSLECHVRWPNTAADYCPRVGVCWAGNFLHRNDANRSIPLAMFASLFSDHAINFVSLQQLRPMDVEPFAALRKKHPNLSAVQTETLVDLATVVLNLDLVITVDTAVAHLAGSLGVPTWILIPSFGTDWRWGLERADSPWYGTVQLFRQEKIGDWSTTINSIKGRLSNAGQTSRVA